MNHSKDVIVFAGALYDAPLWTNRQHIATSLAERGWRVLYVEPRLFLLRMLFRYPGGRWSKTGRSLGGGWHWLLRQVAPQRVRPNLWVQAQANLIPGSRRIPFVGRLNHVLWNAWHVRLHAWELGFREPVLLIYDTEAAEFLDDFPKSRVVYDCVDDHRVQAGIERNSALVEKEESAIAARAAVISVTTSPLLERFSKIHRNVQLVPNAADVEAFSGRPAHEPRDIAAIPHPRIGTVGALDVYKVDVELLQKIASEHPEWHFVLIGPVDYSGTGGAESVRKLGQLSNVHFLGPKPREEVPSYVHAFDVAIIPYRDSPYNRASFPLKFWEFLAAGKPIVASGLPSLEPYRHLVTLTSSADAFARGIQEALERGAEGRDARIAESKRHTWDMRVTVLEHLLSD
ncbi:MAG: glycosyl transferase group 1 [Parcubacteria group bacterium Gr01-1014_38]|nr:MAG: glycosyl transferase group 1 [Parcubacteria group bacterium Gr01-1014_38]